MLKATILVTCLIASMAILSGCETAEKLAEDPFAPIVTPFKPVVTPINDTVEDIVAVHKVEPAGLDTTVSLADQKQVRVSF